jgi:Protein of unknown function (DUF1566)
MRKTSLILIAVCATLLWAGAVDATPPKPPPAGTRFPATGQTTVYAVGDDGYYEAGAPLDYTDNDDGTITDNNTKLMWEMKDDVTGSLDNERNTYPWAGLCLDNSTKCQSDADCGVGNTPCTIQDGQSTGMTIFQWVAALNDEAFAGYTDWRIPNIKELQSIADFNLVNPDLDPIFGPTQFHPYWSSTTYVLHPDNAWELAFDNGTMGQQVKNARYYVRAVRGPVP